MNTQQPRPSFWPQCYRRLIAWWQTCRPGRTSIKGVLAKHTMQKIMLRERRRADRFDAPLALICIDHPTPASLAAPAAVLQQRIRQTDVLGWLEPGSLALLLPNTSSDQTWTLVHALQELLQDQPIGPALTYRVFVYPFPASAAAVAAVPGAQEAWEQVVSPKPQVDAP